MAMQQYMSLLTVDPDDALCANTLQSLTLDTAHDYIDKFGKAYGLTELPANADNLIFYGLNGMASESPLNVSLSEAVVYIVYKAILCKVFKVKPDEFDLEFCHDTKLFVVTSMINQMCLDPKLDELALTVDTCTVFDPLGLLATNPKKEAEYIDDILKILSVTPGSFKILGTTGFYLDKFAEHKFTFLEYMKYSYSRILNRTSEIAEFCRASLQGTWGVNHPVIGVVMDPDCRPFISRLSYASTTGQIMLPTDYEVGRNYKIKALSIANNQVTITRDAVPTLLFISLLETFPNLEKMFWLHLETTILARSEYREKLVFHPDIISLHDSRKTEAYLCQCLLHLFLYFAYKAPQTERTVPSLSAFTRRSKAYLAAAGVTNMEYHIVVENETFFNDFSNSLKCMPDLFRPVMKVLLAEIEEGEDAIMNEVGPLARHNSVYCRLAGMTTFKLINQFMTGPITLAHLVYINSADLKVYQDLEANMKKNPSLQFAGFLEPSQMTPAAAFGTLGPLAASCLKFETTSLERIKGQNANSSRFPNLKQYWDCKISGSNAAQWSALAKMMGLSDDDLKKSKEMYERIATGRY